MAVPDTESMILPVSLPFGVGEEAGSCGFPARDVQISATRKITNFMKNHYKGEIQKVCKVTVHSDEILKPVAPKQARNKGREP
jgi:hypothetical protein